MTMFCFDECVEKEDGLFPKQHLGHSYGPVPDGMPQYHPENVMAIGNSGFEWLPLFKFKEKIKRLMPSAWE